MTIHSATDHGYSQLPPERDVRIGDTFRERCALGVAEYRVLRRHRDIGYYEVVFDRWVTEVVPEFRQGFCGSIDVRSRADILRLKYAD